MTNLTRSTLNQLIAFDKPNSLVRALLDHSQGFNAFDESQILPQRVQTDEARVVLLTWGPEILNSLYKYSYEKDFGYIYELMTPAERENRELKVRISELEKELESYKNPYDQYRQIPVTQGKLKGAQFAQQVGSPNVVLTGR